RASVDCNALRCTHIECDLFNIREDEFVLVEIFSRLYTNTLVDERNPGGEISSLALARVTNTKINWPHKPTLVTASMNTAASLSYARSQTGISAEKAGSLLKVGLISLGFQK
ncbi:hypothetical protein ANCDUO_25787, partial [Ancylostoma duodenale]